MFLQKQIDYKEKYIVLIYRTPANLITVICNKDESRRIRQSVIGEYEYIEIIANSFMRHLHRYSGCVNVIQSMRASC